MPPLSNLINRILRRGRPREVIDRLDRQPSKPVEISPWEPADSVPSLPWEGDDVDRGRIISLEGRQREKKNPPRGISEDDWTRRTG